MASSAYMRLSNMIRQESAFPKDSYVRLKHGISLDAYDRYLSVPCAICGGKSTELDHDHKTGRIRGGLCHLCNGGLGFFKDSPEYLVKAARYVLDI